MLYVIQLPTLSCPDVIVQKCASLLCSVIAISCMQSGAISSCSADCDASDTTVSCRCIELLHPFKPWVNDPHSDIVIVRGVKSYCMRCCC